MDKNPGNMQEFGAVKSIVKLFVFLWLLADNEYGQLQADTTYLDRDFIGITRPQAKYIRVITKDGVYRQSRTFYINGQLRSSHKASDATDKIEGEYEIYYEN